MEYKHIATDLPHPSFKTFRVISEECKEAKFDDNVYFPEYMKDW